MSGWAAYLEPAKAFGTTNGGIYGQDGTLWANLGADLGTANTVASSIQAGSMPTLIVNGIKFMTLSCTDGVAIGKKGDEAIAASCTGKTVVYVTVTGTPQVAVDALTSVTSLITQAGF